MGETKKVHTTGRLGSRYGVGIRKRLLKVERRQKVEKRCPNCGFNKVKRKSKGIFYCRKCGHEFVGGAYLTKTLTGTIVMQMVSQKKFLPEMIEALEKTKEGPIKEGETQTKTEQKENVEGEK